MNYRPMIGLAFLSVGVLLNVHCGNAPKGARETGVEPEAKKVSKKEPAVCRPNSERKLVISDDDRVTPNQFYVCQGGGNRPKVHWFQSKKKGGKKGDEWKVVFAANNPCEGGPPHIKGEVDVDDETKSCFVTGICPEGSGTNGYCHYKYSANGRDPEIVIEEGTEPPPIEELRKYRKSQEANKKVPQPRQ